MDSFKQEDCENIQLQQLRELAEMFPYPDDIDQNESLQSVPDQDAQMPFLDQHPDYPTLGTSPGWMNSNQNFISNLNSAATGESCSPYLEELSSPAPSSTGSFAFTDYESYGPVESQSDEQFSTIIARIGVGEGKLQEFSVKELNRFLKSNGLSKEEQRCLKNRRRTLKNRGYAQNCRIKRIKVKKSLESENERLQRELYNARGSLEKVKRERDAYKAKLGEIVKFLKLQRNTKVA